MNPTEAVLCCFPIGVASCCFYTKTKDAEKRSDYERLQASSKTTKNLAYLAIAIGLVSWIIGHEHKLFELNFTKPKLHIRQKLF